METAARLTSRHRRANFYFQQAGTGHEQEVGDGGEGRFDRAGRQREADDAATARNRGSIMSKLVDLSQEIYQGMPVYMGHLKTAIWQTHTHEETATKFEGGMSYACNALVMSDHGPTHVDSISHFDPRPDAPAVDQMALDLFYGESLCLDVSHIQPHAYITRQDVERALAGHGLEIRSGDIVLFYTGTWDKYHDTLQYTTQYPGLDEGAAQLLADKKVKNFGVDSPSPDNPISKTYPTHMMSRRYRIPHYENLANLKQVAGKRFQFAAFPLKIRGGYGSPVRAVAIVDE